MYWIIFIGFALLSWLVSSRLQSKFEKYSKIPMPNGMTGRDVAEKMLRDNGIYDARCNGTFHNRHADRPLQSGHSNRQPQ